MIRRTFVLSAMIALLVSASARSESPELRYGFQAGRHYGYDITIKIETENYLETQTGYSIYRVISAEGDQIRLVHDGFLDPERTTKPGTNVVDQGAVKLTPPPRSLVIDRRGKLVRSEKLTPLDHILGFLETLVFERLSAKPEKQWHWEEDIRIVETRFFSFSSPSDPARNAKERSDYRITEVRGDLVRVEKKYQMRTGDGSSNASHSTMSGSGWFLFNRRDGAISSLSMNYQLITKDKGDSQTVTASIECRAMVPDRLERLLAQQERQRKQMTGKAYAEGPRKPLEPAERAKLLRDLRSRDPKVLEAAIVRLISAENDDRATDFCLPLVGILQDADFFLKVKAAQALVVWATPEAEAALAEATNDATYISGAPADSGFPLAEAAYHALGTIGTESAARAIAEKIDEPTQTPIKVLQRMGAVAEVPMLELLAGGGVFKQRAACQVLAEIGGLRSARALQQAAEKGNARSQADRALQAVAQRQGLSVEQLLERARSMAPAAIGQPVPTRDSRFRTWSDSTGRFRVEAEMLSAGGGTVKLKTREGKTIDVPLDRLSRADQELVANISKGDKAARRPASPSAPAPHPGSPSHTAVVGGTGGFEFREASPQGLPVIGVRCRTGNWGGKPALASITPVYDRNARAGRDPLQSVVAREGYALGAIQVDADDLVRAVRFAFMRVDDDRLNTSDVYTTDWIGSPTGNTPVTLSAKGKPVLGFHGRKGAVIDALGIVVETQ